jgi:hypothetical protein
MGEHCKNLFFFTFSFHFVVLWGITAKTKIVGPDLEGQGINEAHQKVLASGNRGMASTRIQNHLQGRLPWVTLPLNLFFPTHFVLFPSALI